MALADRLVAHLQAAWLQRGPTAWLLTPLSALHAALVAARRLAYRRGWLRVIHLPVPVLVVGNRIAGGAGKTPTTLALLHHLHSQGWTPGVLTRGHGAQPRPQTPLLLDATTAGRLDAVQTGDEPWLIWRRAQVPLMIGPDRVASGLALLDSHPEIDILVCDDGLQHLRLHRDLEVIVFDERGAGNGWMLPAGPLREPVDVAPVSRLVAPAIVLHNTDRPVTCCAGHRARRGLGAIVPLDAWWQGLGTPEPAPQKAHALAGIAHPARFFRSLHAHGIDVSPLPLRDHARFDSLPWGESVRDLIVTEKDAVKLEPGRVARERPRTRVWVAGLDFSPEPAFWTELDAALARLPGRSGSALTSPPTRHGHPPH
jgi:tetraacyldisaccharide 4'-kinase